MGSKHAYPFWMRVCIWNGLLQFFSAFHYFNKHLRQTSLKKRRHLVQLLFQRFQHWSFGFALACSSTGWVVWGKYVLLSVDLAVMCLSSCVPWTLPLWTRKYLFKNFVSAWRNTGTHIKRTKKLIGVSSLLLLCGFWGLNSGHQAAAATASSQPHSWETMNQQTLQAGGRNWKVVEPLKDGGSRARRTKPLKIWTGLCCLTHQNGNGFYHPALWPWNLTSCSSSPVTMDETKNQTQVGRDSVLYNYSSIRLPKTPLSHVVWLP